MLVNAQLRRVTILGDNRIPSAHLSTTYATTSNQQILAAVLQGLVDRFNLHGQHLDEVVAGTVIKRARDLNLARETVLSTALAKQAPAYDVQQACDTGLETAILVTNKTALGQVDMGIVGGTNTTPDAPIGLDEKMHKILLKANRAKSTGAHVRALASLRPSVFVHPLLPRSNESRTGLSTGERYGLMAKRWGIRRKGQDTLALRSHHDLTAVYERGLFIDLMTTHLGLDCGNNLCSNLIIEQLAKSWPVFGHSVAGTMTAGNPTPFTDGASYVLLASEDWARAHNLPVFAYMTYTDTAAVDFFSSTLEQNEGLLVAPAYAVSRMLQRAGLTLQDFDYYEIHEAFAAQVLSTLAVWESSEYYCGKLGRSVPMGNTDRSKPNVDDNSLGTGHPFAATGGHTVTTLTKILAQRGSGRGLVSVYAAGGQGVVAILEHPETMSH